MFNPISYFKSGESFRVVISQTPGNRSPQTYSAEVDYFLVSAKQEVSIVLSCNHGSVL